MKIIHQKFGGLFFFIYIRIVTLKQTNMKAIFLAAVVSLSALVSLAQGSDKLFIEDAPTRRWFFVEGEEYAGVSFFQDNSDDYVLGYLKEMLSEDSVSFNLPMTEVIFKPNVYLLEWEYVQLKNNKTTRVTYTKEEKYSMLTFFEYED